MGHWIVVFIERWSLYTGDIHILVIIILGHVQGTFIEVVLIEDGPIRLVSLVIDTFTITTTPTTTPT